MVLTKNYLEGLLESTMFAIMYYTTRWTEEYSIIYIRINISMLRGVIHVM